MASSQDQGDAIACQRNPCTRVSIQHATDDARNELRYARCGCPSLIEPAHDTPDIGLPFLCDARAQLKRSTLPIACPSISHNASCRRSLRLYRSFPGSRSLVGLSRSFKLWTSAQIRFNDPRPPLNVDPHQRSRPAYERLWSSWRRQYSLFLFFTAFWIASSGRIKSQQLLRQFRSCAMLKVPIDVRNTGDHLHRHPYSVNALKDGYIFFRLSQY